MAFAHLRRRFQEHTQLRPKPGSEKKDRAAVVRILDRFPPSEAKHRLDAALDAAWGHPYFKTKVVSIPALESNLDAIVPLVDDQERERAPRPADCPGCGKKLGQFERMQGECDGCHDKQMEATRVA